MSTMTHLWVSPRGRHTTVSNHTAWVAQMFGRTLPPEDDPAFKAEENQLYDMAYRSNLMRVLADHGRHTMYVDNLVTGDHYRWIAREGARGNYLVLDTDGKEIADFQPGKRKKKRTEEQLARRIGLNAGAEFYVREALDIKNFILQQPVFHIFQSGDRWAVSVREPVPKDIGPLGKHMKEYARILAYIKPYGSSDDGMSAEGWTLASITDQQLLHQSGHLWDMKWPTKEAAAEEIWKARLKGKAQTATESVKTWIMNLNEPRAREIEYQVWSRHGERWHQYKRHPLATNIDKFRKSGTGFKSLDDAFVYANKQNVNFDKTAEIRKVHTASGHVMRTWKMTESGGLLPIDEAVDTRQFIMQNPGELLFFVNEYVVNTRDDKETRPLRLWIGSEFQDEGKARRTAANVARLAVENPNREIVRVEMEIWDVPATYEAGDAKLLHTYLVKPDGTFEEIAGPADPSRTVVGG